MFSPWRYHITQLGAATGHWRSVRRKTLIIIITPSRSGSIQTTHTSATQRKGSFTPPYSHCIYSAKLPCGSRHAPASLQVQTLCRHCVDPALGGKCNAGQGSLYSEGQGSPLPGPHCVHVCQLCQDRSLPAAPCTARTAGCHYYTLWYFLGKDQGT